MTFQTLSGLPLAALAGHCRSGLRNALRRSIGLFALLLLAALSGRAYGQAITVDAATSIEAAASSFSWTHTVNTGNNRFLVVSISIERDSDRVTSITYGGTPLTFVGTRIDPNGATRLEVWRLIAPKTGANTVSVSMNSSASVVAAAISFANVDQTDPISASTFASGTGVATASASVASASDEIVLAALSADDNVNTVTAGSGQTARWNRLNAADVIGAGSTKPGTASTTMSYALGSSQEWAIGLFSIQPVKLPEIQVTLVSNIVNDPVNGSVNPKYIPGAQLQYCVTVSNIGEAAASQVVANNPLPADVAYVAGTIFSGTACATATDAEDDNASGADETDPRGASVSGSTVTATISTLNPTETLAIIFKAIVN